MLVRRYSWTRSGAWAEPFSPTADPDAQLVLTFGPVDPPSDAWFAEVAATWPQAQHVYCSGGGQISDSVVDDDITIVTVIRFTSATVHTVARGGVDAAGSAAVGRDIGLAFHGIADLRHVLIFAEGLTFNAARFLEALNTALPAGVRVSGGLASNGTALTRTVVGLNGVPATGNVVAVGLAGASLVIGTGSVGGWDLFGPERVVTRSAMAVLYELDGENALDVYRRYLGDFAAELPGIALRFPLAVFPAGGGPPSVRTILAIDEPIGALRFAGDIPVGSVVRLMRTTTDKLIDGAALAARHARSHDDEQAPALTLCVSCIGRRAVMRSRVEEELDEVVLASGGAPVVGFYSNGELAPPADGHAFHDAVLHNQTMTVTTIGER